MSARMECNRTNEDANESLSPINGSADFHVIHTEEAVKLEVGLAELEAELEVLLTRLGVGRGDGRGDKRAWCALTVYPVRVVISFTNNTLCSPVKTAIFLTF